MGNKGACALMPSEVKPFTSISETTPVLQGSSSRYIPPPHPTDFSPHQSTDEVEQTCTGEDTGLLHGEPASIEATNHGPSAMVGVKESVQSNSQINSRGITPRVEERIAQLEHELQKQKIESLERELEWERDERRRQKQKIESLEGELEWERDERRRQKQKIESLEGELEWER